RPWCSRASCRSRRALYVPGHRIDAGDAEAGPLVQGQDLPTLAAAHVEGDGARRQVETGCGLRA
ncbi:MAG TPA: hypothetical protein VJ418_12000, partial [Streptosporangiaceae bacterium]|nr:hypothetical protein [Streptosporangiaceae bacterium]